MLKPEIIVYYNIIMDKKVYIVVFIGQPIDFDRAREKLRAYSDLTYSAIPIGRNAITFIERKENIDNQLLTEEEFNISKVMLMSVPDIDGSLYDVTFQDVIKIYNIEKAVMLEVEE